MAAERREGLIVNRKELAEFFGLTVLAVDGMVKRGCPVVKRGNTRTPWQFDTAAVALFREEERAKDAVGDTRDVTKDEAVRRKIAAEAALAELQLAKERGDCASISDIAEQWADIVANVRGRFLPMGGKLAPQLAPVKKRQEIKEMIDREVREALDELSRYG